MFRRRTSSKVKEIGNRTQNGPAKNILKILTQDESVHSTYGNSDPEEKDEAEEIPRETKIRFLNIHIREYARTIGDNPSCSAGPPIGISWEYIEDEPVTVDTYEETRPPRRSMIEMALPRSVRTDMLKKEWDVSQREIASAVRNNVKTKNQRRSTVNNLGKSDKLEEAMEKAGRKVKRLFKKSTSAQVKKLQDQMDEAEKKKKELVE